MLRPSMGQLRSRQLGVMQCTSLMAAVVMVITASETWLTISPGFVTTSIGKSGLIVQPSASESRVPMSYSSRYSQYEGYVHKRKPLPHLRIRLDRWGVRHWPFYRIKASFQKRKAFRSARFLESLGWWDPMKEFDDPRFFKLKADRICYWLRKGAQPTDQVANLLDVAGIIRRTGRFAKLGEWEWRIPKNSGPDEPEGWKYDGPHLVTWNNEPYIHHKKGHPHSVKKVRKLPLVERFGFQGYEKVPIEHEIITEPVAGTSLLDSITNSELPIY